MKNVKYIAHITSNIWDSGYRVKSVFSFLLGKERKDGDFGCLLIKYEDADKLASFLEYLDDKPITFLSNNNEEYATFIEENASKKWQVI